METKTKWTPRELILNGNTAWSPECKDRGNVFECRLRTGTHIPEDANKSTASELVRRYNAYPAMHEALKSLSASVPQFVERMAPPQICEPGSLGASEHHKLEIALSQARAALAEAGEP